MKRLTRSLEFISLLSCLRRPVKQSHVYSIKIHVRCWVW